MCVCLSSSRLTVEWNENNRKENSLWTDQVGVIKGGLALRLHSNGLLNAGWGLDRQLEQGYYKYISNWVSVCNTFILILDQNH